MSDPPPNLREYIRGFAPKLAEITENVIFGDVWERPGLSKRDRSLITVSVLTALYRPEQLEPHLHMAVKNGVTVDELAELFTHIAFYAGWPSAISAVTMARRVLDPPADAGTEPS